MLINERLKLLITCLKDARKIHNQTDFGKIVGLSKGYVSQLLKGEREISEQIVFKIYEEFPYINLNWLLTGEGEQPVNISLHDDISTNNQGNIHHIAGNCNSIKTGFYRYEMQSIDRLLSIIEKQSSQLDASQGQISKLLEILEKK